MSYSVARATARTRANGEGDSAVNSNQLDYFQKAYEDLSYAAAARRVPMSSQGLAKAIHSLEGELGVPLFTASEDMPGRLRPTPYADELLTFCREFDAAYGRLEAAIGRISGQAHESIRVAVAIGSLGLLGMDLVSSFRRVNPDVDVVCDDLPDLRVEETVLGGEDSLGITELPTPDGLETIPLASCERYVWVNAGDPLARKSAVEASDLAGREVALVGQSFKNYGLLVDTLARGQIRPAELVTSSEMVWLHHFAKSGQGVAFTAQTVIPLYEDDRDVVALPFVGMPYEVGVSWARGHELTDAERAFVHACRRRSAELGFGETGDEEAKAGSQPERHREDPSHEGMLKSLLRRAHRER